MSEYRDTWSKVDILLKAIASVALPLALFWFGHQFKLQQEASAAASLRIERLTSILGSLSSENDRERRIAIEVAGYLAKSKELPLEIVPVLISIAREDPSSVTARAASSALSKVEAASPALRPEIEKDLSSLPARIYFHISTSEQRTGAQSLRERLIPKLGSGFSVPGIERKDGPTSNELRFFKKEEGAEANEIAKALRELGLSVDVKDLSSKYQNSTGIRPRHYELWLGTQYSGPDA